MPFPNGKFKIAGCKTITCNYVQEMIDIFKESECIINSEDTPLNFDIKKLNIAMICSDFLFKPLKDDPDGWCLRQEQLKNILNDHSGVSALLVV